MAEEKTSRKYRIHGELALKYAEEQAKGLCISPRKNGQLTR